VPTIDTSRTGGWPVPRDVNSGLAFKLQRLRSMGPAEIAWRIEQRIRLASWARRAGRPVESLPAPDGGLRAALARTGADVGPAGPAPAWAEALERAVPGEVARVVARADAIRAGRVELFATTYEFGPDPARWPWNRSPDGGPEVALEFGPTLDYRDVAIVGDARLAWELGRHGYLVPVAQAGALTGDPVYARFVFATFEAWSRACPPYQGIQWVSALEFALRSLAWGFSLALLARSPAGDAIEEARWERVLAMWAEQLRFVNAHDARYSSANNHRLGEAAGLAWGGRLLSFLDGAGAWHARGLAVLEDSFLAQTTADGVTKEHAFAYQHFVLDFVVAVEALEARAGRVIPAAIAERMTNVAEALDAFAPGGRVWAVGDGDEGQALPTGEPFAERARASLDCAARLLARPGSGPPTARAFWMGLEGGGGAQAGTAAADRGTRRNGYVVYARNVAAGEARLLFDAAELGLAPLYAHGHADALMVLLDVNGPRLVDAGTGGYHAHAEWREKLRATAAHNTVELDGVSQSAPGGLFQWLRAARIVEGPFEVAPGRWSAAHDGYRVLPGGVLHRRTVAWDVPETIVVTDRVEGGGRHRARTRWHLGRGVAAPEGETAVRVTWPDGFVLTLAGALPAGGRMEIDENGLWAPRFLQAEKCCVVTWITEGALPLEWTTTIVLGSAVRAS
jgi:hypothetical protein